MAGTERGPIRLAIGASAGGHTDQLLSLLKNSSTWPCEPALCVTSLEIQRSQLEPIAPTHVVGECYRRRPFAAVGVFYRAFQFAKNERPDVIVTTGSLPLALVCIWVKVFGGKVVWIDSVSQMSSMSMSGQMVRRFADLALVQWPKVAAGDDKVEYVGQLV